MPDGGALTNRAILPTRHAGFPQEHPPSYQMYLIHTTASCCPRVLQGSRLLHFNNLTFLCQNNYVLSFKAREISTSLKPSQQSAKAANTCILLITKSKCCHANKCYNIMKSRANTSLLPSLENSCWPSKQRSSTCCFWFIGLSTFIIKMSLATKKKSSVPILVTALLQICRAQLAYLFICCLLLRHKQLPCIYLSITRYIKFLNIMETKEMNISAGKGS